MNPVMNIITLRLSEEEGQIIIDALKFKAEHLGFDDIRHAKLAFLLREELLSQTAAYRLGEP